MGRVPGTVPTRVFPLLITVFFSAGEENHESGQGQLSRHMCKTSGPCIPLLATPGLSRMSAQSLLPLPHWFYLPGSSWLPGGLWLHNQRGATMDCRAVKLLWVLRTKCFLSATSYPVCTVSGIGIRENNRLCVICRNQPATAIPGCTTSLHPGKVSRE